MISYMNINGGLWSLIEICNFFITFMIYVLWYIFTMASMTHTVIYSKCAAILEWIHKQINFLRTILRSFQVKKATHCMNKYTMNLL